MPKPPAESTEPNLYELNLTRTETFPRQNQVGKEFLVTNVDSATEAKQLFFDQMPDDETGLPFVNAELEQLTPDDWKIKAEYLQRNGWKFSTQGGTQRVFRSLQTMGRYGVGGIAAPNYYGSIGVTQNSIEGVELDAPGFCFERTVYYPAGVVNDYFLYMVGAMANKVNVSPFLIFAPGECRFRYAQGSWVDGNEAEITYHFAGSPNIYGAQVDTPLGRIGPFDKRGWDYLWYRFVEREDLNTRSLVRVPIAAYVEQVYYYSDLNYLRIYG